MDYPNMSYCAFENTALALEQLIAILETTTCFSKKDFAKNRSSREEAQAFYDVEDLLYKLQELYEGLD